MKLRVSRFFKKKRNYLKLAGGIACGAYIMTGMRIGFTTLNDTLKNDYYTLVYNLDDDLIKPLSDGEYDNINMDKIAKMDVLSINMAEIHDLGFLKYCSNLEKIEIKNAELLTNLHIDQLNQTNIKEYYFFFDRNYVLGHMNEGADFSRLSHPEYIKKLCFMDEEDQEELDSIIFRKYLNSLYATGKASSAYDFLYYQLIDMVENLNLDKSQNDLIKFIDICNYVVDHLYYDPEIGQYLAENSDVKKFSKEYKKARIYNDNSLTSVAGSKNAEEVPAICANYSSLLSALCIQNNIEIYRISGTLDGSGHAWNLVKFQDNYYYVDMTQLDISDDYQELMNNYRKNPSYDNICNLINYLFIPLDSKLASYYVTEHNIEQIKSQKILPATNDNFFGTLVNEKEEIRWYLGASSIAILFLLCELAYEFDIAKTKKK